ncbi:uncharacterized protein LOC131685839 [Topomyia yanbarensis]|uniref:uncharacterized protein LOC131685839 n=1 Tax=Topomyia yanbarensis TaxID=2498891 RepID=UPI00273B5E7A|nr:uncharacterized protein LOC131685839 [Topomyia yanbarensis]
MSNWSNLPPKALFTIVKRLSVRDQKSCTLVCSKWNRTVADILPSSVRICLSKWLKKEENSYGYQLLDENILRCSKRRYHYVEVSWSSDCTVEFMSALSRMLRSVFNFALRHLIVNATPDEKLSELFQEHSQILNHITELTVLIGCPFEQYGDTRWQERYFHVSFSNLRYLEWVEKSMGNIRKGEQIFIITAPQLEFIKLATFSNWTCFFALNFASCESLKSVKLELPNRVWPTFPNLSFNKLDQLVFTERSKILGIPPVQYGELAAKMPNLTFVQMEIVENSIFDAFCEHCPNLRTMHVYQFVLSAYSFSNIVKLKSLKNLALSNGRIVDADRSIDFTTLQGLHLGKNVVVEGNLKSFPLNLSSSLNERIKRIKRLVGDKWVVFYETI